MKGVARCSNWLHLWWGQKWLRNVKRLYCLLIADPRKQGVVGFVWMVVWDDRTKGGWILNDPRYGCIDLWVSRGGRVIFVTRIFFDRWLYSEVVDEEASWVAVSSLPF